MTRVVTRVAVEVVAVGNGTVDLCVTQDGYKRDADVGLHSGDTLAVSVVMDDHDLADPSGWPDVAMDKPQLRVVGANPRP